MIKEVHFGNGKKRRKKLGKAIIDAFNKPFSLDTLYCASPLHFLLAACTVNSDLQCVIRKGSLSPAEIATMLQKKCPTDWKDRRLRLLWQHRLYRRGEATHRFPELIDLLVAAVLDNNKPVTAELHKTKTTEITLVFKAGLEDVLPISARDLAHGIERFSKRLWSEKAVV